MKRILAIALFLAACKQESAAPAPATAADPVAPTAPAAGVAPARPRPELPPQAVDDGSDHQVHHRNFDTDGDGKISDDERTAARRQRAESMRTKLDTNGDGKLTPDELASAKGRMHFDDPAAVDTNHDGDISTDELMAAMAARRDQMRAQWGHAHVGAGGSGAPTGDTAPTNP